MKKYATTLILIGLFIVVAVIETQVNWVDAYYNSIYPYTSNFQRILFGWIPFSIGDIFYLGLIIFCVFKLIRVVVLIIKTQEKKKLVLKFLIKVLNFIVILCLCFKLFWGLNYNRSGISKQFNLKESTYCKEQLLVLINDLIIEANFYRSQIPDTSLPQLKLTEVLQKTKIQFKVLSKQYPFLAVKNHSIKSSLFSATGNYLGFIGYYNPFTGEAQIRNDIPSILFPFTASHEVAHQLGYASEDEANFIAYLIAINSKDVFFKYCMCLEILDYAFYDLILKYYEDFEPEKIKYKFFELFDCLDKQVKTDRKNIKYFFKKNRKNFSNISSIIYDKYLRINNQESGIHSYNKVLSLIIFYRYPYFKGAVFGQKDVL